MFQTKSITKKKKIFFSENIGGLASIILCHIMDQLRPITGNHLEMFILSILSMLCLPNNSNTLYHVTKEDQLSAQHKLRTGECFLGEHCVHSWINYSLKWGIPWNF